MCDRGNLCARRQESAPAARAGMNLEHARSRQRRTLSAKGSGHLFSEKVSETFHKKRLRPYETLIKALVRASLAPEERERSREVDHRPSGAGGCHRAYVCRLLPLTCLAPDIVEAILDGRKAEVVEACRCARKWTACLKRPEGDPGASAIDTKLVREVRSRGRTVGSKAETDRAATGVPNLAVRFYARKQPCWRVTGTAGIRRRTGIRRRRRHGRFRARGAATLQRHVTRR
jgi:hypothetical protein